MENTSPLARAQAYLQGQGSLREELIAERERLVQEQSRIGDLIKQHDEALAALGAIASTEHQVGKPSSAHPITRTYGVKNVSEEVAREFHLHSTWTSQELLVEAICKRDDRIKPKSAAAALSRLHDEGVLDRRGKRGSYQFSLIVQKEHGAPVAGDEAGLNLSPAELIVGKLKSSPDGCSKKDLSWTVGDVSDIDTVLNKLIEDGEITVDLNSGKYKLAERVTQPRSLFGNDDLPPAQGQGG